MEVFQVKLTAERIVNPVARGIDRDADAVVFAEEEDRRRAAAPDGVARRIEAGESGRVIRRSVSERAEHNRIVAEVLRLAYSARSSQRERKPRRLGHVRR